MERKELFKRISFTLKILTVISSFSGVLLGIFYAERDGYSHWGTKLMYFTGLSNLWIGVSVFLLLIAPYTKKLSTDAWIKRLYVLRYIFVVSITVTCFVYCFLLAPFSEQGNFTPWTFSNILTHVVAPVLAVADFFLDEYKFKITKEHIIFTAVPPAVYFVFAGILNILDVDFGRGDTYPYFFLNLKSPAGIFGFSDTPPFVLGSFYWVTLFLLSICGLALIYSSINNKILKRNKKSLG